MRVRTFWLAVAMVSIVACATTPTGRRQLKLVPGGTMDSLGASAFAQIKQDEPISTDVAANRYVKCLADALIAQLEPKWRAQAWEVVVFDSDTVNAFALPGGKIGVYRGLMEVAQTPDQLVAVMGHEVAHVLVEHGNERISQNIVVQGTVVTAGIFTSGDPVLQQSVMAALGIGAQLGVLLPYSRKHESEADSIGLDLMAKAGFHPKGAVELWQNMSKLGGKEPPQFLSTHPSHTTRIQDLTKQQTKAMTFYEQAKAAGRKPNCVRPNPESKGFTLTPE